VTKLGLASQGRVKKPQKPKPRNVVEHQIVQKKKEQDKVKQVQKPKMIRAKAPLRDGSIEARKRFRKKNPMVPVIDTDARREAINKQLARKGMLKELPNFRPMVTVEQDLPQVSTIDIVVDPYVNHFVNLGAQWSWFLFSKKIGADLTTSTSVGVLGQLYMAACAITLDLFQSMKGGQSYFNTVPPHYLELFRALGIKERMGHKYSWNIPADQALFGVGGFLSTMAGNPTGSFPLYNGDTNVSLSWITSSGSNANLNTSLPALTDDLVFSEFYAVAMDLFSQLSDVDGSFSLVSVGAPTAYDKSIGIFSACSPLSVGLSQNNDFCAFTNEVVVYPHEYWCAMIGLAFTPEPNPLRAGVWSINEYQTASAYGLRLISGVRGKRRPVRPRYKYFYLEEFVIAVLVSMIQADLFNNEQYGSDDINQLLMTKSALGAIWSGDLLAGIASVVVNRFWCTSWLSADKTRTGDYPLFGMKYYTAQITQFISAPQSIIESIASSMPFYLGKGLWDEAYCGILVCRGSMYANIFESTSVGNSEFLQSFVQNMYPSSTIVSYGFNPTNTSGMTEMLDPNVTNIAQFLGTSTADAMVMYNTIIQAQQGNYSTCLADANVHMDNTILHYSKIGVLPSQDNDNDKGQDEDKSSVADPWTDYATITLTGISNIIPFSPNLTSDDMSKVIAVSLVPQVVYQGIFNEIVSLPMDEFGVTNIVELNLLSYIGFAHHYSGDGFESSKINDVKIVQQQGGGFYGQVVTGFGGILQGLGI